MMPRRRTPTAAARPRPWCRLVAAAACAAAATAQTRAFSIYAQEAIAEAGWSIAVANGACTGRRVSCASRGARAL